LWRNTLSHIPTIFGQLAYLATLRDPATGQYGHPALTKTLGIEEADRALRHSHHRVFMQWLMLSLADQKSDLDEFLDGSGGPPDNWNYRDLPPQNIRDVERLLYLTDLETLLELLSFERENAPGNPKS
jgi:hypothetical protein